MAILATRLMGNIGGQLRFLLRILWHNIELVHTTNLNQAFFIQQYGSMDQDASSISVSSWLYNNRTGRSKDRRKFQHTTSIQHDVHQTREKTMSALVPVVKV